jgi:hypothetical protein
MTKRSWRPSDSRPHQTPDFHPAHPIRAPRDRTISEMRSTRAEDSRSRVHTCSECGHKFSFPIVADEGQGDIRLHCPTCRAELCRIERKYYTAERERWALWTARIHRALEKDVIESVDTEPSAGSSEG